MLLSMTGHGEARTRAGEIAVGVEVRTINGRYFKLTLRCGAGVRLHESQVEEAVRQHVRRGTVTLEIRIDRPPSAEEYRLNEEVLLGYRRQLLALADRLELTGAASLDALLALPGVVAERQVAEEESDWPLVEAPLAEALARLTDMRRREGEAMAADLAANCRGIGAELAQAEARAPSVLENYRQRLLERINAWLGGKEQTVGPADVAREAALFADRCDTSEEFVRLRSHLRQFDELLAAAESSGRKLEFLTQEMFREANTIAAKASDAEIAQRVIEIKAAIERMREMIQNVE